MIPLDCTPSRDTYFAPIPSKSQVSSGSARHISSVTVPIDKLQYAKDYKPPAPEKRKAGAPPPEMRHTELDPVSSPLPFLSPKDHICPFSLNSPSGSS